MFVNSAESEPKIVILWDLIKQQIKESEQNEMARLIGKELIDQLEDLRTELTNLFEISKDIDEQRYSRQQKKDSSGQSSTNTAASSILSQTKNANFLNQELKFLLTSLQEKAIKSGMSEDALLPKSARDQKILKFLKRQEGAENNDEEQSRPQSPAGASDVLRASFYSFNSTGNSMVGAGNQGFGEENLVKQLKISNILELSSQDLKIVQEFKRFMQEQANELQNEIDSAQDRMLEEAAQASAQELAEAEQDDQPVTQKDLREFGNKLKEEMLNSDHTVKIANLPTPSRAGQSAQRKGSLPRMTQTPVKPTKGIKFEGLPAPLGSIDNEDQTAKMKILRSSAAKIIPTSTKHSDQATPLTGQNLFTNQNNLLGAQSVEKIAPKKIKLANGAPVKMLSTKKGENGVVLNDRPGLPIKISSTSKNSESKNVKQLTEDQIVRSPQKKKRTTKDEDQPIMRQSLYGLDFELLKQLNMENEIEESLTSQREQQAPKKKKVKEDQKGMQDVGKVASGPNEEQSYEDLRQKFALDNNKAASRLRATCYDYTVELSDDDA